VTDVKNEAFAAALESLFLLYPVPGNPDNRGKAKGVERTINFRRDLLKQLRSGYPLWGDPHNLKSHARSARVPENQVLAIYALVFR
jgi:hypothetical protein